MTTIALIGAPTDVGASVREAGLAGVKPRLRA